MNTYTLNDEMSWDFIQTVLLNAGWDQDDINNMDEETLTQVCGAINSFLMRQAEKRDENSPMGQYQKLMEIIANYPGNSYKISEVIKAHIESGGEMTYEEVQKLYQANDLALFNQIADIVGKEKAAEAWKECFVIE